MLPGDFENFSQVQHDTGNAFILVGAGKYEYFSLRSFALLQNKLVQSRRFIQDAFLHFFVIIDLLHALGNGMQKRRIGIGKVKRLAGFVPVHFNDKIYIDKMLVLM